MIPRNTQAWSGQKAGVAKIFPVQASTSGRDKVVHDTPCFHPTLQHQIIMQVQLKSRKAAGLEGV